MLVYLVLGITYGFAAGVQPGPFQAYLISLTLNQGWRRTLPAIFAPLISDGPIAVLVLMFLSQVPARMEQILHLLGGVYVLYLAYGALQSCRNFDADRSDKITSAQQGLLKAALVNLLNPGPYLGWSLVLGPLLVKGWREAPSNGIALLAAFYCALILSTAGIIMLFTAARSFGPKVNRILIGLSSFALACFGIYQLWLGTIP